MVQHRWCALVVSLHGFNSLKCMFIEEYLINRCNDRFNDRKLETPFKKILEWLSTVWKRMRASCEWWHGQVTPLSSRGEPLSAKDRETSPRDMADTQSLSRSGSLCVNWGTPGLSTGLGQLKVMWLAWCEVLCPCRAPCLNWTSQNQNPVLSQNLNQTLKWFSSVCYCYVLILPFFYNPLMSQHQ